MTFTHGLSTNNYGVAKFIVSSNAANGTHTTIQSAINAASSGDNIFIRPGTYTENLTLSVGVNLCGMPCDGVSNQSTSTSNVTIVGKCSFSGSGTVNLANLRLQTNGDFALSLTGGSSIMNIYNCDFQCTNHTGISITNGKVVFDNCTADITTLGNAHFAVTGGVVKFRYCRFENTILSVTANTNSGADLSAYFTIFRCVYSTSITGNFSFNYVTIEALLQDGICISAAGAATNTLYHCALTTSTTAVLDCGGTTTTYILDTIIQTTAANQITGTASVHFSDILNRSDNQRVGISTTTKVSNYTEIGKYTAIGQPCFSVTQNGTVADVTGDGTNYQIIFNLSIFDNDSNFNTTTGTFTAPVTGRYQLNANVLAQQATTSMSYTLEITTSNRPWRSSVSVAVNGNNMSVLPVVVDMDAADTAVVKISYSGGTKVVDIYGGTSTTDPRTSFSGFLLS